MRAASPVESQSPRSRPGAACSQLPLARRLAVVSRPRRGAGMGVSSGLCWVLGEAPYSKGAGSHCPHGQGNVGRTSTRTQRAVVCKPDGRGCICPRTGRLWVL